MNRGAEDSLIWNHNDSANFRASAYVSAHIQYPVVPADQGNHWVMVHLKSAVDKNCRGLRFEKCVDLASAKRSLAVIAEKLERAGVVKVSKSDSSNRFDHVELPE